ncbi:hypothetical protein GP486_005539 [Trichoglossum hirsutum]|uniref:Uncharacterized protein n=1 Tax=Trichoglossum hirsutum TaxID=265104 RepID=A0A9P8RM33_9PEZI|nr:hypothetical protein GP486_005539 [Trichoglossum hirsutum]
MALPQISKAYSHPAIQQRDSISLTISASICIPCRSSKLAQQTAGYYSEDDALNLSPRLQPTVPRLNRSPSPQRFVSQPQTAVLQQSVSPPSSKHSKKPRSNRRHKTQPSQGDVVLVGFLGSHEHPDTAQRAGDEALPSYSESSDSEESDQDMDTDRPNDVDAEHHHEEHQDEEQQNDLGGDLRDVASQALQNVPGEADADEKAPGEPEIKDDGDRRASENVQSDVERNEGANGSSESENNRMDVDPKVSDDAVGGLLALKSPNIPPSTLSPSHARSSAPTNGSLKSELATSPTLRDYAIPPYGSTLPAITTSMPPPNSPPQANSIATSHGERPNLPSLHSHLNQLAEAAEKESTQPFDVRANGAGSGPRPSFPAVVVGAARSPPTTQAGLAGSGRPRVQYMTARERQEYQNQQPPNHYPPTSQYSQAQTSPVSSYSETSPQEPFPHGRELPSLSPPPGPGVAVSHPYWFNRRPSQASENGPPYAPVPQAESSYPPPPTTDGSTPASVGSTPRDHRMSIDDTPRPTPTASLPPQQTGPPPVGVFRCEHAGCTAAPFQTQYLLK